ncbi:hypothetical protein CDAR_386271 [Caerostris darwini]|uniref:Uncharacterized protein n=1 Tax=Caerostris darwini TaxID=1538125 RepID=A0AAV4SYB7_9ARAC|nr:hypothetical protein CDAR_386271 [Caerostris darwini]
MSQDVSHLCFETWNNSNIISFTELHNHPLYLQEPLAIFIPRVSMTKSLSTLDSTIRASPCRTMGEGWCPGSSPLGQCFALVLFRLQIRLEQMVHLGESRQDDSGRLEGTMGNGPLSKWPVWKLLGFDCILESFLFAVCSGGVIEHLCLCGISKCGFVVFEFFGDRIFL